MSRKTANVVRLFAVQKLQILLSLSKYLGNKYFKGNLTCEEYQKIQKFKLSVHLADSSM